MRMVLRLLVVLLAGSLGSGCSYRLGSTSTLDIKSIAVPNFKNETYQPNLSVQVTDAVIKRIQQEGSLKVLAEDMADATMTGVIVEWNRSPLRYNPKNVIQPSEYRLLIKAHVVVINSRTGKHLIDRDFVGTTFYFFGDDLAQAERQATPLVAADLARRITDSILDAW